MSATTIAAPRLTSEHSRWGPLTASVLLLAGIFLASPNFRLERGSDSRPFAGDVLQEWVGSYVVRCGDYQRFYEIAYAQQLEHDEALVGFAFRSSEYFPLVYPPFYYLLVSPLSFLPFPVAALLWAGLIVLAYLAAWKLFERCIARTDKDVYPTAWLLPVSLLFMPLIENFTTCQKGSVLLLILTATFYLLTKQRPYWAGVVFGLIAFKPQFALPIAIAMLCKRQFRFVLGGLTTASVLIGLCLLMGLDVCQQYVDFSTHAGEYLQNAGYDLTKSHTWAGFFTLLLGESNRTVTVFTLVASGITIGIAAWALRGPLDTKSSRFAWQFSALVIATVLLSPHLYTYDLTVLLLPLGLVRAWEGEAPAEPHRPHGSAGASPSQKWLALLLFCLAGLSPQVAGLTGLQLSVPLMLAFLWAQQKAADTSASGFETRSMHRPEAYSTIL